MSASAVITGFGLVTPLGRTAPQTWDSILAGRHITTHSRVEALDANLPRVTSIAREAADEAIRHANWTDQLEDIAVVACTSKGSVESWMSPTPPPTVFGLADLSSAIARHIGSNFGPRLTLSAACTSGLHGLIRGTMMIQSGQATRVLVVAAEASVHPLFLASFKRLGVLPDEGEFCRPFDQRRSGFLMSEAAAAVCLEVGEAGQGLATIDRYAMGGDAAHLTGSDPDGRVLRTLLNKVNAHRPLDLFHAHGTGTITNDATELAAIEAVVPAGAPLNIFSHKAALGHSLGASGLVAIVLNCLAHRNGVIPGNINTIDPMPSKIVTVSQRPMRQHITRSLVHAAGFGGPMSVVCLTSVNS